MAFFPKSWQLFLLKTMGNLFKWIMAIFSAVVAMGRIPTYSCHGKYR